MYAQDEYCVNITYAEEQLKEWADYEAFLDLLTEREAGEQRRWNFERQNVRNISTLAQAKVNHRKQQCAFNRARSGWR